MRCLWLTLADPDPPRNGQFLYSDGLIQAVASAGTEIEVVGLARPGARHRHGQRENGVRWWLADHRPRSNWAGLVSTLPHAADRTKTRPMRRIVDERLEQPWDVIVFDSPAVGWALPAILKWQARAERPAKLAYVSHNHEENVARRIVAFERHPLKRRIKQVDALKAARLERALIRHADLVTSNSPEDRALFRARWPEKPIEFLPPGYGGRPVAARRITKDTPRRAIIVGSFDWIAKRVNLEEFLAVVDPLFAKAGIELQVVGGAEDAFLDRLRNKVAATSFTGRVAAVEPYMAEARLALVPDYLGGFKLKALDYVFNRLPILALSGSVPGMPLRTDDSVLLFRDHEALAKGVLRVIDDLDRLNALQERAYAACRDRFDWSTIGGQLLSALSRAAPIRDPGAGDAAIAGMT